MAVIQKALGVCWGVAGTGFTYTGAATVLAVKNNGEDYKRSADKHEVKDGNGEVIGLVFNNQQEELTLRVYPYGSTLANANTANVLPAIGDKFVVIAADDAEIAGNYIVESCGKARTIDGHATFDITVRAYASDLSATVS
jgi:hypothetical protein